MADILEISATKCLISMEGAAEDVLSFVAAEAKQGKARQSKAKESKATATAGGAGTHRPTPPLMALVGLLYPRHGYQTILVRC